MITFNGPFTACPAEFFRVSGDLKETFASKGGFASQGCTWNVDLKVTKIRNMSNPYIFPPASPTILQCPLRPPGLLIRSLTPS